MGTVSFGHDLADGGQTLVPNPRELEALGWVREWRAAGWSLRQIARELDRLGTPSKTGKLRWAHTSVVRLLERTDAA